METMTAPSMLAVARKAAGLTQKQVADALGCPQSYVARWEAGSLPVSDTYLDKLAELLGIDPWALHALNGLLPPELEVDPRLVAKTLRRLARRASK